MGKMKIVEKTVYVIVGIMIVIAVSMLLTVRAESRCKAAVLFDNSRYEAAERTYKEQVKEILGSFGLYHSGLTMTRVVSLEGDREYTIQVYNEKILRLGDKELRTLENEIKKCQVVSPDGRTLQVTVYLTGDMS